MIERTANQGAAPYAADTCLDSLLAIDADTVDEIYGSVNGLRLGAETLVSILQGERRYMESLGYAVSIMQVENNFRRKSSMQADIGLELQSITTIDDGLELHEVKDLQAEKIAELYTRTISTLSPRIIVNGRPQFLQVERTVSWIRTLLFAGLRSAVLWRQMGGGRFSLMFGRKKMLEQAQTLLPG